LNGGLKSLLGLPGGADYQLWPDATLEVRDDLPDEEEAVRVGLHHRPDLNLLRCLLDGGDDSTGAARRVLAGVNPLLAGPPLELPCGLRLVVRLVAPLAGSLPPQPDARATREQLTLLLAERERQAEREIRAAVVRAKAQADLARLHAERVGRLAAKQSDLVNKQNAGQAVAAELARARADVRKAEGDRLEAAVAHAAALVRLRQAQGLLVREAYGRPAEPVPPPGPVSPGRPTENAPRAGPGTGG
jgi:hypothetical protein